MEPKAQLIFWLSYMLVPLLAISISGIIRGRVLWRVLFFMMALPLGVLSYARFIEPQRLIRVVTPVEICGDGLPGTLRAAVLSDIHQGIFHNAPTVSRLVNAINRSEPDLVLIPGDFTYALKRQNFEQTFAPLEKLQAPAYAVLGNHDNYPGKEYRNDLVDVLESKGIIMLAPGEEIFTAQGKYLRIVGIRDLDSALHDQDSLGTFPEQGGMPSIVISHNPDVITKTPGRVGYFDLMVAGHTHGGQVWIPGLTCKVTSACDTWRYGLAETPKGKLFVSAGTGMVNLPFRFNMQPRIDLLDLKIRRCQASVYDNLLRVFPHGAE